MTSSLHLIGINHKSAPLTLREQLAFTRETIPSAMANLLTHSTLSDALILSTCNRLEIYTMGDNEFCVAKWLCEHKNACLKTFGQYAYHYKDLSAIKHLAQVASGLDSMALGEPQILGQVKEAYLIAQEAGGIQSGFHQLFPAIFSMTKLVRSNTDIGKHPVSIAYTALKMAKTFMDVPIATTLFIGTGETIELAASHFAKHGCQKIFIANRSLEKAKALAAGVGAQACTIADIPTLLPNCDIVITATASTLPILGKGVFERALKIRNNQPILAIDLAIPRDIEAEVSELSGVTLLNIDDLQKITDDNRQERELAAEKANLIIDLEIEKFLCEKRIADASEVICEFRDYVQAIRDEELSLALKELRNGKDPALIIAGLAHNLTNKTLHHPTINLRQAAYEGHVDVLKAAKKILISNV